MEVVREIWLEAAGQALRRHQPRNPRAIPWRRQLRQATGGPPQARPLVSVRRSHRLRIIRDGPASLGRIHSAPFAKWVAQRRAQARTLGPADWTGRQAEGRRLPLEALSPTGAAGGLDEGMFRPLRPPQKRRRTRARTGEASPGRLEPESGRGILSIGATPRPRPVSIRHAPLAA